MKTAYLLLLLSLTGQFVRAQYASISGRLINKEMVSIANASIVLFKNEAEMPIVTIVSSNNEGRFQLMRIACGKYLLKISCLGYAPKEVSISLSKESVNLGDIVLNEINHNIDEVVVTSARGFAEKTTYRLSDTDRKSSSNALDAMRLFPKLLVNMSEQLLTTKGDQVKILVNGANATESDLLTIPPENIVRIEYYQTPPARYAIMGIGALVNVITKKNLTGGQVAASLLNAVTTGFGNDLINFKYNFGNSQVEFKYSLNYRDYYRRRVNEILSYSFNKTPFSKIKTGIDSPYSYQINLFEASFINQKSENYLFNAIISLNTFNQAISSKQSVVQLFPDERQLSAVNREKNRYLKPTVDLYFSKKIKKSYELSMNVVGTYYDASFSNAYLERSTTGYTNFFSSTDIKSDKYSLISDAVFSYKFKAHKIAAGVRDMYAFSAQDVLTTSQENLTSNQNDFYGFLELSGSRSKFSYTASVGFNHSTFKAFELNKEYSFLYFRPAANLRYRISTNTELLLSYQINTRTPLLSELSNNRVMKDYYIAYSGNPNLKPYTTHAALLSYDYKTDGFTFIADLSFDYAKKPILPYFTKQTSYILETFANLRDSKKYSLSISAHWYPVKSKWLKMQLFGEVFRNENRGDNFSWQHNDYRLIPSLIMQHKKWEGNIYYQSSVQILNGQLLTSIPGAAFVELTYKPTKNMAVLLGLRYPFYEAWRRTYQTHQSAPVLRNLADSIFDNANMVYLQYTCSFSFGKQSANVKKRLLNVDKDSGIYKQD